MATTQARALAIDALRNHGLVGLDEEEFVATLPDLAVDAGVGIAESHDWQTEVDAMRAEGLIQELGCTWIGLSLAWWVTEVRRTAPNLTEGQAREIVEMLAGRGS